MALAIVMPTEGTIVQVGDGAMTEVFTDILQVTAADGPNSEAAEVKTTNMLSLAQESRPSFIPDNGELSFSAQLIATDTKHIQLEADIAAGVIRHYRLIWNNGTTSRPYRQISAYVKSFGRKGGEPEANIMIDVVLRATGVITGGVTTSL
jgi:hypothetical protein